MSLHVYERMEQRPEDDEEWRHIPGFDDRYEVSNLGRVRSYCVHGHIARTGAPHVLVARPHPVTGYLSVGLQVAARPRSFPVHTLVAAAFIGPRPDGYQIAHADGDRLNSRAKNLRYATPSENAEDKQRHGTTCRGESDGNAKLVESEVQAIRHRYRLGEKQSSIAQAFGISQSQVSNIVRRASWAHLDTEPGAA